MSDRNLHEQGLSTGSMVRFLSLDRIPFFLLLDCIFLNRRQCGFAHGRWALRDRSPILPSLLLHGTLGLMLSCPFPPIAHFNCLQIAVVWLVFHLSVIRGCWPSIGLAKSWFFGTAFCSPLIKLPRSHKSQSSECLWCYVFLGQATLIGYSLCTNKMFICLWWDSLEMLDYRGLRDRFFVYFNFEFQHLKFPFIYFSTHVLAHMRNNLQDHFLHVLFDDNINNLSLTNSLYN